MTDWRSTPSTGLRRLQFRSLSLPPESPPVHPLIDMHLRTLNVSCFHPIKCFRIGVGLPQEGVTYFNTFSHHTHHPR